MDIARPSSVARNKRIKRIVYSLFAAVALASVTFGLSRLKPAAPSVERSTILIDAVKRGLMLRQVRGMGTLVPEDIRWIPATTNGRVERILVLPGAVVRSDTVLLELSNPELELEALAAQGQLKSAEAALTDLRVRLESQRLDQQAAAARIQSEYHQAKLRADRDEALAKDGLLPDLNLKLSKLTAEELANRYEIEKKRLDISLESIKAQLDVQRTTVDQQRGFYQLKKEQVESLRVRSGVEGVLQQLPVQVGQQVTPGTNLARVAEPGNLKAELKVVETQAKDIQIGQVASIDTRNGVIPGRVMRIDPAVQNGTVTVDVKLEGPLPKGARPDLSVDGTIELERLEDVLYVQRPAFAQENSLAGIFKLGSGGKEAARVQVRFGRSSVNTIEVVEGLNLGDQVILSDMNSWDDYDRVQLN